MDFVISLFYILVMLLVLAGAYVATRILATKSLQMLQGKYIKVVDRIILGKDKSMLIVQIGNNHYLATESSQGFNIVGNLEEADLIPLENEQPALSFQSILEKYLNRGTENSTENADENMIDTIRNKVIENIKRLNKRNEGK